MDELLHWPRDRALTDAGPLLAFPTHFFRAGYMVSGTAPNGLRYIGVLVLRYIVPGSLAVESSRIDSQLQANPGGNARP
jgi:hypothetical protein